METFRMISGTACFLGIVIAVFNAMYPSEKFVPQLKIIFSLIFILCIAKPIAQGKLEFPEIPETVAASSDYYSELSARTDEYFIRSVENSISRAVGEALAKEEIYPLEIETSINISENFSISIREVKIVLNDPYLSEKAKRLAAEQVGDEAAVAVAIAGKEDSQ